MSHYVAACSKSMSNMVKSIHKEQLTVCSYKAKIVTMSQVV